MNSSRKIQKMNLEILARNSGFQFTDSFFPYTSGQIGPYKVNSAYIKKNGKDYKFAVDSMSALVLESGLKKQIEVISGGESLDWIFSLPLSTQLIIPHLMIYKNGRTEGADIKGKQVLHIADVNNEGSSPRDTWVPKIKKLGGQIKSICFYIDRLEDGVQVMEKIGLQRHVVVPLDKHAWDYLKKMNVISEMMYTSLMTRMEDKDAWAIAMLRSQCGLEKLAELLKEPTTKKRATKILTEGYPEIQDEISNKLITKCGLNILKQ